MLSLQRRHSQRLHAKSRARSPGVGSKRATMASSLWCLVATASTMSSVRLQMHRPSGLAVSPCEYPQMRGDDDHTRGNARRSTVAARHRRRRSRSFCPLRTTRRCSACVCHGRGDSRALWQEMGANSRSRGVSNLCDLQRTARRRMVDLTALTSAR